MTRGLAGVSAVVLAAGESKRFGRPKALEPWHGEPLVRRIARVAASARTAEVVVVAGEHAERVAQAVAGLAVSVVENVRFRDGQSTSVRAGIEVVRGEAALVIPVDQPRLTVAVLDRLIATWAGTRGALVVPEVAGRRRAPVLISRPVFAAVERLQGDAGMRQLFDAMAEDLTLVSFDDEQPFLDVDTPEDWRRLSVEPADPP